MAKDIRRKPERPDNAMTDELAAREYQENAGRLADSIPQKPEYRPSAPTIEQVAQEEIMMLDLHAKADEQRAQIPPKIGVAEIRHATEILEKYKSAKSHLEDKIVRDEQFWKMKQWDEKSRQYHDYKPATAYLWSSIQSRHADAMDSAPTVNLRPRQEDDKKEAKVLSSIIPVILEQNRFEDTYSDFVWYWLKHGAGALGVFWNKEKLNGLGDIEIKRVDLLNLFWESGVTDLQDSENVFCVEWVNKKQLLSQYPQLEGHLDNMTISLKQYRYDDQVDTEDKAVVVDWYYHTFVNGKKTLQYVKYVNDVVLYATENDNERPHEMGEDPNTHVPVVKSTGKSIAERGLYDHGQYPFVCRSLFPIEGSLCGYGLIDIASPCQIQIDVMNKAITENTVINSAPRYFFKESAAVNEDEFTDHNKPIVHVAGDIANVEPIKSEQLGGIYLTVLEHKIDEMKYITANQDVGNGIAPSGVTAASAIAALQETQGKNSRDANMALYREYRDMIYQVIELIRQFYELPRTFRIAPDSVEQTEEQYITYTNERLKPQPQIVEGAEGEDFGFRTPEFDIEVSAEKQSPYKKIEQNELSLNFFKMGFFNPQMAEQALACLQLMDFPNKQDVIMKIQKNAWMYQKLLEYQQLALRSTQTVAMITGKPVDQEVVQQVAQDILQTGQMMQQPTIGGNVNLDLNSEGAHMTKARSQARDSTAIE